MHFCQYVYGSSHLLLIFYIIAENVECSENLQGTTPVVPYCIVAIRFYYQ